MNLKKLGTFARHEKVLIVAAICAAISMLAIPPDRSYGKYIDFQVIFILFCLMAIVAGFQECGVFRILAQKLLTGKRRLGTVNLALTLMPFLTSMFITNDVALITFVPFTIFIFETLHRKREMIRIIVLQTIAANLGSMATPVGNPQNLFLFSHYGLTASEFFPVILPITGISLAILLPAAQIGARGCAEVTFDRTEKVRRPRLLALCLCLFLLCLFSVFGILDYRILVAVVAISLFFAERTLLLRVDYALLFTFICFFIFSGNLGAMPTIESALRSLMDRNALIASAVASQIISNVPAAVLLAPLTENWHDLLLGVDIGGLGTPVASLASLISLKLYLRTEGACPGRYMVAFTAANALGLALLLPLAAI
ncbi:MAG: SLC13 family permease [Oscillospiraceae bacterium]